jgi:NADPH:quinone reductase-like Zn-dependent oxidoreductase
MRAFVVEKDARHADIPLSFDAPEPKPRQNQVLIDVYSAGVNFFEVCFVLHIEIRLTGISPDFTNTGEIPEEVTSSVCTRN